MGASAGVLGLLGAFATLFPEREACFVFYFFPVRLKARVLFWAFFILSLFGVVFPFGASAHGAHLGGLLAGWAYARWIIQAEFSLPSWQSLRPKRRSEPVVKVRFPKASSWQGAKGNAGKPSAADDFISKEVDPILEKISAHGIQSLTDGEKQILEAARNRMGKK